MNVLLVLRLHYLVAARPSGLDKLPWIEFNVELFDEQGLSGVLQILKLLKVD